MKLIIVAHRASSVASSGRIIMGRKITVCGFFSSLGLNSLLWNGRGSGIFYGRFGKIDFSVRRTNSCSVVCNGTEFQFGERAPAQLCATVCSFTLCYLLFQGGYSFPEHGNFIAKTPGYLLHLLVHSYYVHHQTGNDPREEGHLSFFKKKDFFSPRASLRFYSLRPVESEQDSGYDPSDPRGLSHNAPFVVASTDIGNRVATKEDQEERRVARKDLETFIFEKENFFSSIRPFEPHRSSLSCHRDVVWHV